MSSENEQQPILRIAIVGGGIAGLSAAYGVLKAQREGANVKLDVYEGATKFAEIGAGVAFGPNAQRALRMLRAGDVIDNTAGTAEETDDPDTWFDVCVGDKGPNALKPITTITGKDASLGSVHRADFLEQLVKKLPSYISHFDHHCSSYTPHPTNGTITLHFDPPRSGEQGKKNEDVEVDVVIASDGIKSTLRKHLYERKGLDLETQQAVYSDWVAWRGMIPAEKYVEAMGEDQSTKMMFFGKDKHILTFPVRHGELVNIVAFVKDKDHKKLGDHTDNWAEDRPRSELLEDFASFDDKCLSLLKEIDQPSIWGIFVLPELEISYDDGLVLIGDAKHAMTPHQGAGAGQAVEDALFISTLLTSSSVVNAPLSSRPFKVQKAIKAYVAARHERSNRVLTTSNEAGELYEFNDPEAGADLAKIKAKLDVRQKWIWNWDTEGELKKALDSLDN